MLYLNRLVITASEYAYFQHGYTKDVQCKYTVKISKFTTIDIAFEHFFSN